MVYGPIANDKAGLQIRKLQDGSINFEIVMMLIENKGMDIKSAFDCVYNSETYAKLSIPESGLNL